MLMSTSPSKLKSTRRYVGRPQLGYRATRTPEGTPECIANPSTVLLIAVARNMQAEGVSLRTIARILAHTGLASSTGEPLRPGTLSRVLKRTVQLPDAAALAST